MPLKLNVGLSKKIGLPRYGSLGAACYVELELAGDLLHGDMEVFRRQVRLAYTACRQAVDDELACSGAQHASYGDHHGHASGACHSGHGQASVHGSDRYRANGDGTTAGNGQSVASQDRTARATDKQLEYVRRLASQIRGLGIRRLDGVAHRMFGKPLADLSSFDASSLIDALKAVKAGEIDVDAALNGAAA